MTEQVGIQLGGAFLVLVILLASLAGLIAISIRVLITCRIFGKAGYHWALGLLILVPIVNIIIPFYLAFADWPVQRQLRDLKPAGGPEPM